MTLKTCSTTKYRIFSLLLAAFGATNLIAREVPSAVAYSIRDSLALNGNARLLSPDEAYILGQNPEGAIGDRYALIVLPATRYYDHLDLRFRCELREDSTTTPTLTRTYEARNVDSQVPRYVLIRLAGDIGLTSTKTTLSESTTIHLRLEEVCFPPENRRDVVAPYSSDLPSDGEVIVETGTAIASRLGISDKSDELYAIGNFVTDGNGYSISDVKIDLVNEGGYLVATEFRRMVQSHSQQIFLFHVRKKEKLRIIISSMPCGM